ncbi:MAG: nuclease-related domain-containing protein [Bacillus sp. (in: firmicutes)]
MIVKSLEIPLHISKIEALLKRLPPTHEKISLIQSDLKKIVAGYHGEKSLDYPFCFLPEKEYYILHDLRLFDGKNYFQIDVLILSTKYFLLLEVKNIAGELYFDTDFNQLIRTKEGKKNAFSDPLIQVKRLELQFKKWLKLETSVPIYGLVVISNPASFIHTNDSKLSKSKKIIHRDSLPFRMEQIAHSIPNPSMDEATIKKWIKELKKKHTPLNIDITTKYHLKRAEIQKGAFLLEGFSGT